MLSRVFRDDVISMDTRKRQIDTLKIFNDNVTEIKEDSEYKVEFLAGDVFLSLHITLPDEFPCKKPCIKVEPSFVHPWISGTDEIDRAPGLLNFTVHSDLGRVVQVIVREFQIRPPVFGGSTMPATVETEVPRVNFKNSNMMSIPELAILKKEELQALNDDPQRLNDFVMSLSQVEDLSKMIETRIAEIECIAEDNLSKQATLEKLKKKVMERVEEAQELKASFEEKNKSYETLCEKYQPENIKYALRAASLESDEQAEAVADRFLNGEMGVEQFLVEYVDRRKLSQTRKTKEEKLSSQLRNLKRAGY